MRLTILLPLCAAIAAPAYAQNHGISGITTNFPTPMSGPITGYGPDNFRSVNGGAYNDVSRAQRLIASGNYAQADGVLTNLVGRTSSRQVRFLKGVARLGLGDATGARRYFEQSLYRGRNGYPGAMSGLALAEIRLGNRDAAQDILGKLRNQQEKCGSDCDRAKPLDQAIAVVEKALA
ncbi:tetratricopeptide repeat protein [Sphingobium cupriresistens]|uniref:Tetratricopeptide repeat protein n=1 Tax=Sphingobium cupriresistens TaxID=1132417 RepID=A0A8G1ZGK3_9SPHN|nr:tetratricopeptide repeat protein [Sphingobium cupriresistens]RYM09676.1 tetratricopeptide repeat protein [Sphingobium cupriresistens]